MVIQLSCETADQPQSGSSLFCVVAEMFKRYPRDKTLPHGYNHSVVPLNLSNAKESGQAQDKRFRSLRSGKRYYT